MARTLQDLEQDAMELGETERLAFAEFLMASVPFDPNVEGEELAEIVRRLKEVEDGTAELIPAEEVFRELRKS